MGIVDFSDSMLLAAEFDLLEKENTNRFLYRGIKMIRFDNQHSFRI